MDPMYMSPMMPTTFHYSRELVEVNRYPSLDPSLVEEEIYSYLQQCTILVAGGSLVAASAAAALPTVSILLSKALGIGAAELVAGSMLPLVATPVLSGIAFVAGAIWLARRFKSLR